MSSFEKKFLDCSDAQMKIIMNQSMMEVKVEEKEEQERKEAWMTSVSFQIYIKAHIKPVNDHWIGGRS